MKRLQGFIAGLLVGLSLSAYAALTTAQVSEHLGRCIRRGFAQDTASLEREVQFIRTLGDYGKDWVPNGTFGTQADRLEAMQTTFREIFTAQTGLDPVNGGSHFYKRHWLVDVAGLTPAEVNTLEP